MEQWLRTVKGENVVPIRISDIPQIVADISFQTADVIKPSIESDKNIGNEVEHKPTLKEETSIENIKHEVASPVMTLNNEKNIDINLGAKHEIDKEESLPVLKISMKDGKQIISQVDDSNTNQTGKSEKSKNRSKDKSEKKSNGSSKSSSSRHSSKHSSSDKHKSSSHKISTNSSSPSRHSNKEKSRDKEKRSSHSSSSKSSRHSDGSKKSSSSSKSSNKDEKNNRLSSESKDDKSSKLGSEGKDDKITKLGSEGKDDKIKEKDGKSKDRSVALKIEDTPSIMKLGKIPKLTDVKREKPSISIEIRKPDEPKPKTVKTFHAKFRKHGLEEEIKPPPSRASLLNKKVLPVLPPTVSIPVAKRPSPVHNETPPEKKIKIIEPIEKPGAIKLIPAKPKRKCIMIYKRLLTLIIFIFTGHSFCSQVRHPTIECRRYLRLFSVVGKSEMCSLMGSEVILLNTSYFSNKTGNSILILSLNIDLALLKHDA